MGTVSALTCYEISIYKVPVDQNAQVLLITVPQISLRSLGTEAITFELVPVQFGSGSFVEERETGKLECHLCSNDVL